jgi:hypothetical protein
VQISNVSVASLFQQLQALAGGAFSGVSFGADLTGQNLPTSGAGSTSSAAASPLSLAPSSQFASGALSALLAAQTTPTPQTLAANIISTLNPGGDGTLSLGQVEQALTGASSTTSPQQLAIANAFNSMTGGSGALTQNELASALQSLQQSGPAAWFGGHHHHHHHHLDASSGTGASTSSTTPTTTASAATGITADASSAGGVATT